MRLIDADELKEWIAGFGMAGYGSLKIEKIVSYIDGQDTAFELESVIAELEKESNDVLSNIFCYEEDDHNGIYNNGFSDGLEKAIKILKSATNDTNGKIGG